MNDSNSMWQIWIFGWIKVRFWLCLRLKQDEMEFMFIWCNKNFYVNQRRILLKVNEELKKMWIVWYLNWFLFTNDLGYMDDD
jgi:hypothetical protein